MKKAGEAAQNSQKLSGELGQEEQEETTQADETA